MRGPFAITAAYTTRLPWTMGCPLDNGGELQDRSAHLPTAWPCDTSPKQSPCNRLSTRFPPVSLLLMVSFYHACRWPSDPIQTAVINTAASARWKDAVVAGELTQPFAGWGGKPLKRLAVGGLAHHRAKAIVSHSLNERTGRIGSCFGWSAGGFGVNRHLKAVGSQRPAGRINWELGLAMGVSQKPASLSCSGAEPVLRQGRRPI